MKLALCLIVKGDDREAVLLERCLENVSPYVDGIFITITQPNRAVSAVARKFNASISEYVWNDDFASARNFNFAQVPKEYDWILWTDADDIWRGLEKLRPILEKTNQDGFGFWYLYEWDEFKNPVVAHKKTMVIRNDGCCTWQGALHEDLMPTRRLDIQFIEGIDRLHLTVSKRSAENAKRNLQIAEKQKSIDPRDTWNLANAQFAVSDFEKAKTTFEKFIEETESDEERYLAHTRLAGVYKSLGKRELSLRELQKAIGLDPSLPDAYIQLASYYYDYEDMRKAWEFCIQGLVKRPKIHKMIVFNPRDYDYNPLMLASKIAYRLNQLRDCLDLLNGCLRIYPKDSKLREYYDEITKESEMLDKASKMAQKLDKISDKEKLKKELAKLPDDLRSHPSISIVRNKNFIKQSSSGRDLVIYCGNTIHQWNPELFKTQGFGGSEEAIIHLAEELGKKGWKVTVYNNCGYKEMTGFNVTYKPFWEFNYRDKQDVVILWRWAKPLDAEINAPKIYLDLHDVIPEGELTEKRLAKVTKIFVKSNFHRSLFPNVPSEKFKVIPNGYEIYPDKRIKRDKNLIINTSSPDRSMDVLPRLFKQIKAQYPKAKLQWAYGWDNYINTWQKDQKKMQWMEDTKKAMKDAGIEELGRLSQEEVGKLYQKASILAYPTEFAEIDCISVRKAQAAGCIPVTTDIGALSETNRFGVAVHSEKTKDNWNRPYQFHFGLEDESKQAIFVEQVVGILKGKPFLVEPKPKEGIEWAKNFSWAMIAEMWHREML